MTFTTEKYCQHRCDEIIDCWNQSLPYDPISKDRFMHMIVFDQNFDQELALTALLDNKVIGFCLGMKRKYPYLTRGLEPERGWITVMFVAEPFRKRGYGSKMLERCESLLKQKGASQITLAAYSPNYFTPGVDLQYTSAVSFFEKHGYEKKDECVSMARDLYTFQFCETVKQKQISLKKEGISFIPYREYYMDSLLELTAAQFGAGWTLDAMRLIRHNDASKTIMLAVKNDKVIGFCMRKIDGNDGRFGPIGISEKYRDKGLGGVLLEMQMKEMQKQAVYSFYCLWTGGAARRFYERHGLHVYRTYNMYRKDLAE